MEVGRIPVTDSIGARRRVKVLLEQKVHTEPLGNRTLIWVGSC